jgi:hypothetical protein
MSQITELEAESLIDHKDSIIRDQAHQIEILKIKVRELETKLETAGAFVSGGMEEVNKLRQHDQQRIDDLEEKLIHYSPIRAISAPKILNADEVEAHNTAHPTPPSYTKMSLKLGSEVCVVDFAIGIRFGIQPDDFWVMRPDRDLNYPGNPEEIKNELMTRLYCLSQRAPLLEDVRGPSPVRTDKETIHQAALLLTKFRYFEGFDKEYREAFDNLYHNLIEPNVDEYLREQKIKNPAQQSKIRNNARKNFRTSVDRTFAAAEKAGRGKIGLKPTGQPGPQKGR